MINNSVKLSFAIDLIREKGHCGRVHHKQNFGCDKCPLRQYIKYSCYADKALEAAERLKDDLLSDYKMEFL